MTKRKDGESFPDYKKRQGEENKRIKKYLSGRILWDSSHMGTAVRKKFDTEKK